MNLTCACFGHRYRVLQRFPGASGRRIGCPRCLRSWGMHDETQSFLPWTRVECLYKELGYVVRKWPLPEHRPEDPVAWGIISFFSIQLLIYLLLG